MRDELRQYAVELAGVLRDSGRLVMNKSVASVAEGDVGDKVIVWSDSLASDVADTLERLAATA